MAAALVERDAVAHIELQVMAPCGAPLPLSDESYWSDFVSPLEVAEVGGAEFALTQTWRVRRARLEARDSG